MKALSLLLLVAVSAGGTSGFFASQRSHFGPVPRVSGLAFPPLSPLHAGASQPQPSGPVSPDSSSTQPGAESAQPAPEHGDHLGVVKDECPYGTVCVDEYLCPPYGRVKLPHHGPSHFGHHGPAFYPPGHGYGPYGRASRESVTSVPGDHGSLPAHGHGGHHGCGGYGRVCCKKEFLPYHDRCHGPFCGGGYPGKHHGYGTPAPYGGYSSGYGHGYPSYSGYGTGSYNAYPGYGGYDAGYGGYGYDSYGYGGSYGPVYGGYGSHGYGYGAYAPGYGSYGYGGYDPYASGYGNYGYGSPYGSPYGPPHGHGFPGPHPIPFGAEGANASASPPAPGGDVAPEQGSHPRSDSPPLSDPQVSSRTSRMF